MFQYVHHVHYVVKDRDAMVAYLEKNFGMKPDSIEVSHNGKEALYNIGKTQMQIVEPSDPNSKQGQYLAKHGPGVFHVAWGVPNIEQLARDLAANGNTMEMRNEGGVGKSTAHGYMVCNLHAESSLGVRFQLVAA